jgi:hypothetical protein
MIYGIYGNIKRLLAAVIFVQACFFASAAVTDNTGETLNNIRKNRYLTESLNLRRLAKQSFAGGDYGRAERFAEEAVKAARLSDLYVGREVKIYTANVKMSAALERLVWADSAEARRHFPSEFYDAKAYYNLGLIAKEAKNWNDVINNADNVIKTLGAVKSPPVTSTPVPLQAAAEMEPAQAAETTPAVTETPAAAPSAAAPPVEKTVKTRFPAQYVVRSWDVYGDCFWNIAGRPGVYGDPHRWPLLYQANRKKLPEPDNPDLIEPGTVIDIPAINGEERAGLWESGGAYSPLGK